MKYYVSVTARLPYSAGYEIEAPSMEEARKVAEEDFGSDFRERDLCYELIYDEPFSDHEISEIEAEDESERWVP